jgi:TonB family protein
VVTPDKLVVDTPAPAPSPEPAPAPDPAAITPIPLDWQPLPKPVSVPLLVCPATAERGVTGVVVMQVEVDETGAVTEVVIRNGFDPECDALARDALLHADFEPARSPDGEPIASSLRYEYEFTLGEES